MKAKLADWSGAGYHFNLDWLLRSMNTLLTGEAKYVDVLERALYNVRATGHVAKIIKDLGI